MKGPDKKNQDSLKIQHRNDDIVDCLIMTSQYFLAMSVGVWLTIFQENSHTSVFAIALFAISSFGLSIFLRLKTNKIRRSKCHS